MWHGGAEGDLGRVQCVGKSSHRVSSGHSYFVRDGDVSLSCLGVSLRGIDTEDCILSHREQLQRSQPSGGRVVTPGLGGECFSGAPGTYGQRIKSGRVCVGWTVTVSDGSLTQYLGGHVCVCDGDPRAARPPFQTTTVS